MSASQTTLIDELEVAVASKAIGDRADMMRRITNLFASGSTEFTGEQVALFDEIMSRLIDQIEQSARATLSQYLITNSNAPVNTLRKLALDDSIEVAGKLLSECEQLDEGTLLAGAQTKSQDHLLAISRRPHISESVTDVLVERGNKQVAMSTAGNLGARLSDRGYSILVRRSESDDGLARRIWSRPDVPRQHLLTLFSLASVAVRREFTAANPRRACLIEEMVRKASDQVQADARERSAEYRATYARLQELHHRGGRAGAGTRTHRSNSSTRKIDWPLMGDHKGHFASGDDRKGAPRALH